MAQLDDIVGAVMKKLKDEGLEDDTILAFTTDNGTENFTWPDGGQTPFAGGKGTVMEGGFRVPCIVRWPGKVPAGKVENGLMSGLDWLPTFAAAAGDPDIVEELKKGKTLGDRTYKVHLDGYNQLDLITGKGPSKRTELFYFAEGTLGAVRIGDYKYRFIDQPNGWLGGTVKPNMADPREPPPRSLRAHGTDRVARVLRVGSSSSSGGSFSSSRRWRSSPRRRSSSRRCRRGPASTWRPSSSRSWRRPRRTRLIEKFRRTGARSPWAAPPHPSIATCSTRLIQSGTSLGFLQRMARPRCASRYVRWTPGVRGTGVGGRVRGTPYSIIDRGVKARQAEVRNVTLNY